MVLNQFQSSLKKDKYRDGIEGRTHLCAVWKEDDRKPLIDLKRAQVHMIVCTAHVRMHF